MKKKVLFLLPLAASLMLAGCGKTTSSSSESASASASASVSASTSQSTEEGPTITSIKITAEGDATKMDVAGTLQLTATVEGTGDFSQDVTWGIDNPELAIVDGTGLVTGISQGHVNVTATSNQDKTKVAFYSISVSFVAVTDIEVAGDYPALFPKESEELDVQLNAGANPKVTWSIDKTDVATIDENGKVTAVAAGAAVVTATSVGLDATGAAKTATFNLTVKEALPTATEATVADLKAITKADGVLYKVTGVIEAADLSTKTAKGVYNNTFYLVDDSGNYIQVYQATADMHALTYTPAAGTTAAATTYTHDAATASLKGKIANGYKITLLCVASPFNSTPEVNAYVDPTTLAKNTTKYAADMTVGANGAASFDDITKTAVLAKTDLAYGTAVTVNVAPAKGYTVASVKVTNMLGATIDATVVKADATYAFKATCVNHVAVTFMEKLDYTEVASYTFTPTILGTAGTGTIATTDVKGFFAAAADTKTTGLTDVVTAVTAATNVYNCVSKYEALGLKLGSSKANGVMTLTVSETSVRKIVVKTTGWTATDTLAVGDAAAQTMGVAYTAEGAEQTLTFNVTAATTYTFTSTKRAFISSIEFYKGTPAA
jgi:uncharacterized protein YjdB